jgi:ABC-type Fe3+/spermidine/putrescine transport system ATPase subunit
VKAVCSKQELIITGADSSEFTSGENVTLAIRPENIFVTDEHSKNTLTGIVKNVTYKGTVTRLEIDGIFAETVFVNIYDNQGYEVGDAITVAFPAHKLLIYKN